MTKFTGFVSIAGNIFEFEYALDIGYWDFFHPKTMDKF
jgi:hypothetical protein